MKSRRTEVLSPGSPARAAAAGYTLMEILIAMGILVTLGGGLVSLLGHGVSVWNTAEKRGRVYETARALLERIAEDLRGAAVRRDESRVLARFLADEDPSGRQRLRFVRATSSESSDPVLRQGGRFLGPRAPALYDGFDDASEGASGTLRPAGGLMEVLYLLDPRPEGRSVWRGVRAPPGGPDSLFIDANVEEEASPSRSAAPAPAAAKKEAVPAKEGAAPGKTVVLERFYLEDVAAVVADDIIHLGFRFWTQATNTWDDVPPLDDPRRPDAKSGPSSFWDSTRAVLAIPAGREEGSWRPVPGSIEDPSDDVFPERVEVTVVIGEEEMLFGPRLAETLGEKDRALTLTAPLALPDAPTDRFVLVGGEWVQIESVEGLRLVVTASGRGARFTKAARHDSGTRVEAGLTFRRVVEIPGFRTGATRSEEPTTTRRRRSRP